MPVAIPDWEQIAAAKRETRESLIPNEWKIPAKALAAIESTGILDVRGVPLTCGLLSDKDIEITEKEAHILVKDLLDRVYTSVEVTTAFCKRATIAQQLTNCLTEVFFKEAIEAAARCDAIYESTGMPTGSLHGLPVSLKDCFEVIGHDTSLGHVVWCNSPADEDRESIMTQIMIECGAILYCKTNVSQAMMIAESYNNVWGYTANPFNRNATSGGSSGGESALLAMKGSPLGIGTDIGGSLRIPASMCALYTLKPSFGRFATFGHRAGLVGQEAVRSINGPMAVSLDSCKMWAKAVVDSEPWLKDPNMLPIPWRQIELPAKLSFGIIYDDGIVKPTPPVIRGLKMVAEALRKAGHEVVEWQAYNPAQGVSIIERFFVGDGGHKMGSRIAATGEPWPQGLSAYAAAFEQSKNEALPVVPALWDLQAERSNYMRKMLQHWNASAKLTASGRAFDGVISPASAYSSCLRYSYAHVGYTCIWNICDQSSVVFPVTTLDPKVDVAEAPEPRNETEKKVWDFYDAEKLVGCPVGLQVIGRKLEEEKTLEMASVIVEALKAM